MGRRLPGCSALSHINVEVQTDKYDQYHRIVINNVSLIEGERITAQDLATLLECIGFNVRIAIGCFGGENDDEYEDDGTPRFVPISKVRPQMYEPVNSVILHVE